MRDTMSGLPQSKEYRYTIEEFEEMDFGDLAAELIDGLVVVAEAFPSDQHGLITANLAYHLRLALDASGNQQCRPMSTSGNLSSAASAPASIWGR